MEKPECLPAFRQRSTVQKSLHPDKRKNKEETAMDFECLEGKTLEHMRLLIEGAVVLYENDVMPLYSMAMKQGRYQNAAGLDTIGAALTGLQNDIRELQAAHALRLAGQEEPSKND